MPDPRGAMAAAWVAIATLALAAPVAAQLNMPNPKEISGVPLPTADVPAGTVSVRVIRGSFANNVAGQPVEITVDGRVETLRTGEDGRVQVTGLSAGARVSAVAVVGGERLESQAFTMGSSGIRVVLVATDAAITAREEEDRALAAGPAVKGFVVFSPESRVIVEMRDDRLTLFYILQIMNTSRSPVDIGGPVTIDLPRSARGAGVMEGSGPNVTVNGPRVNVTGPFAPGLTPVNVAFELPYSGGTAHVRQSWPVALQQVNVLAVQLPGLGVTSPQVPNTRQILDQGQPLIVGTGPAIPAGGTLELDITGLPYHSLWPRYVALGLAGTIVFAGLWAAFLPPKRERA